LAESTLKIQPSSMKPANNILSEISVQIPVKQQLQKYHKGKFET
jgi:hypothetical protein